MELGNQFTNIKDFYLPVLNIIKESGGTAQIDDIYLKFIEKFGNDLDQTFFSEIKDGDLKWRDYINRAGYQLKIKGYISRGFKRGVWQLTSKTIPSEVNDI
jgi:hypothetical protein